MNEPAFDELLRRLAEADAEFVVVGGLAMSAWGVVRGTKDVDVVVAPSIENLKKVAEVAVAAGGHVQQGEALLGTPVSIAAALATGEQDPIETDLGPRDLADLEDPSQRAIDPVVPLSTPGVIWIHRNDGKWAQPDRPVSHRSAVEPDRDSDWVAFESF